MYTLGIETSCDETAVALLKNDKEICSQIVLSQTDLHKYFGGIVPELASRKHLEVLLNLVDDVLKESNVSIKNIELISVTRGPGLVGALLIGLSFAKSLAYSLKIPIIGINHIEAHLYANFMEHPDLRPPCIGLIVSGGHTTLVDVIDVGKYRILGQTLDDAAGEAFDKVAKLLKLGYPGGPVIDNLSREGNPKAVAFPRAMTSGARKNNFDFSFSGLKTAVVYYVKGYSQYRKDISEKHKVTTADLATSFQEAVVDQLIRKTLQATKETGYKTIILGGGVSRNSRLRGRFQEEAEKGNWKLYIPSPLMCTDNAAMVAGLGRARYKMFGASSMDLDVNPRLALTD